MSPLTDCKKEPVCDSLHNSVLIISLKAIFNLQKNFLQSKIT